ELVDRPITALAVTTGFLRSEEMLERFGVAEENWRDGAAKDPHFIASETPLFVGRAGAALAADPEVGKKAGRVFSSWDLAKEYGLVDADGSRPDWKSHWESAFGGPYPTADEDAYATWFDGPVERWLAEQKARGEGDPRGARTTPGPLHLSDVTRCAGAAMSLAALGPGVTRCGGGPRRKMRRVTRAPGDHPTSAATQERSSLVVPVTRFKGGLAAVLEGWPWFATIAALAVINLGSAPLLEGWPAGIFWLGGLNLVLVLAGLFAVHRRHRAPPQEYEL